MLQLRTDDKVCRRKIAVEDPGNSELLAIHPVRASDSAFLKACDIVYLWSLSQRTWLRLSVLVQVVNELEEGQYPAFMREKICRREDIITLH